MDIRALQAVLAQSGRYHGALDGLYGPQTGAAVMLALADGPDTPLTLDDYIASAGRLECEARAIHAFATVESGTDGFAEGRPVLLFEPHRFSRATKHRFDVQYPDVSYPVWTPKRYPRSQAARYAQLVKAVGLDVDAGFASASYGKFQILGENATRCGYSTALAFAIGMARDERAQLVAFERFIISGGLVADLRAKRWANLAKGYNGTAFRENGYDDKLAAAYAALGGR